MGEPEELQAYKKTGAGCNSLVGGPTARSQHRRERPQGSSRMGLKDSSWPAQFETFLHLLGNETANVKQVP